MISTKLKHSLKAPFRSIGLDLVVRRPYPLDFLASLNIKTILDVGAHEGGFAEEVRAILPAAMLHSFEPVAQSYRRLKRREAIDPQFKAWNVAIGDQTGSSQIMVNTMSASSSFLPLGSLSEHRPDLTVTAQQTVEVITLDDWSRDKSLLTPMLLKADVQGFEGRVLAGAHELLSDVSVVILEVSFEQVYVGQPLFDSIYSAMINAGFRFHGQYDPWFDPMTARQIQSNAIFERG